MCRSTQTSCPGGRTVQSVLLPGYKYNYCPNGESLLGGRFGFFLCFLLGGGEGGVRGARRWRGFGFLLKIPGGGFSPERGGGPEGLGCLRGFGGGGGLLFFFFGGKMPTKMNGESFFAYSWSFFAYSSASLLTVP